MVTAAAGLADCAASAESSGVRDGMNVGFATNQT